MNDFQCERFFLPCDWPIRIRAGRLAVEQTQWSGAVGPISRRIYMYDVNVTSLMLCCCSAVS